MKRLAYHPFFIRLLHWEFWNSSVIYAPLVPYWIWLSIKSRSFYFLTAANPSIKNGGYIMESKKDVYDLLPSSFYPATLYFDKGVAIARIVDEIESAGISFPLIVKPDIGERGLAVKKVKNITELAKYVRDIPVPFLVQEFVSYENEAGVFWCRIPGATNGVITGIVNKEPVVITGDGVLTVAALVMQNKRYILQWKQIQELNRDVLDTVPAKGEQLLLIPYGNHSRGSLFTDHTFRVTEQLSATMDRICGSIPDFYYGRLDIRFRDWESLEAGKDFSIIEVNGSGSEPTHIYDPRHSIFFAWREIIKHWDLLYKICRANNRNGVAYMTLVNGRKEMNSFREIEALLNTRAW
jgi:hypothetical protein